MKIVPYSNEKQQVVNLLVELQEYLVSADEERVQTIDDEYGEKYFTYLQGLIKKHEGIILLAVSRNEVVGFIAGYIEPKEILYGNELRICGVRPLRPKRYCKKVLRFFGLHSTKHRTL